MTALQSWGHNGLGANQAVRENDLEGKQFHHLGYVIASVEMLREVHQQDVIRGTAQAANLAANTLLLVAVNMRLGLFVVHSQKGALSAPVAMSHLHRNTLRRVFVEATLVVVQHSLAQFALEEFVHLNIQQLLHDILLYLQILVDDLLVSFGKVLCEILVIVELVRTKTARLVHHIPHHGLLLLVLLFVVLLNLLRSIAKVALHTLDDKVQVVQGHSVLVTSREMIG